MTLSDFKKRYHWNPSENWIGGGGFGSVYKARDTMDNRRYVAIKISEVKPEFGDYTLQREFDLVKDLPEHRNIARYKDCFRFQTEMGLYDFAVLKYYESGNLEQFLESRKTPLHEDGIYSLVEGILQGIYFLHQNEIIHRDIKAQNVLIDREDGVWVSKIADFGVSRESNMDISISRGIAISYPYAAPEQLPSNDFNAPKIRSNVDLWAIGVMIYRIVMNGNPFVHPSDKALGKDGARIELIRRIWNVELPAALDEMPQPYQAIVRRCLIKDVSKRAQNAGELLQLLNPDDKRVIPPLPVKRMKRSGDSSLNSLKPQPFMPEVGTQLISKPPAKTLWIGGGLLLTLGLATFLYKMDDLGRGKSPEMPSNALIPPSTPVLLDTTARIVVPVPESVPIVNTPNPNPNVPLVAPKPTVLPPVTAVKPPIVEPKPDKVPENGVQIAPQPIPAPTKIETPTVANEPEDNKVYDANEVKMQEVTWKVLDKLEGLEAGQLLVMKLIVNKLGQVEQAEFDPNRSGNMDADRDRLCIANAKKLAMTLRGTAKKNGKPVRFSLMLTAKK